MGRVIDENKLRNRHCAEDDEDGTDGSGSVESEYSNFQSTSEVKHTANIQYVDGDATDLCNATAGLPGAAPTYQTVHQSPPLFSQGAMLLDSCVLIWVTISHLLLTFWPLCGLAIMTGSLYSRALAYFTVAALGTLLLPPCRHSERVVAALDACIFRHWKRHISLRVVHEAGFDAHQKYVVTAFPHGVFPLAAQMHATVWPSLHHQPLSLLTASVNFYCPLWRHYMSVGGCVPASFKVLQRELAAGHCALVHAGGIAEMFVCERDREVAVVRNRRGFVRAAVEAGVPLLPVYYFGNSQLLSIGPRCMRDLSRRLKMSIGLVYGVLGLPILRRVPVTAVVGPPIPVGPATPPGSPAYDARVEAAHERFLHELAALYARHCYEYNDGRRSWEDRPLVMT